MRKIMCVWRDLSIRESPAASNFAEIAIYNAYAESIGHVDVTESVCLAFRLRLPHVCEQNGRSRAFFIMPLRDY